MADRTGRPARIERWRWPALAIGSIALPLAMVSSFEDAFAPPKTVVLGVVSGVLLLALLVSYLRLAVALPRSSAMTDPLAVYLVLTAAATIGSIDPPHSLVGERFQYQGLLPTVGYAVGYLARSSTDDVSVAEHGRGCRVLPTRWQA
jgi:hypothetical protein